MTIGKKIIGGYLVVLVILMIVRTAAFTRSNDRRSLRRVSRFGCAGHFQCHGAEARSKRPDRSISRVTDLFSKNKIG